MKSGVKLPVKVSELRWKLGRARLVLPSGNAKQESSFRFYVLYDRERAPIKRSTPCGKHWPRAIGKCTLDFLGFTFRFDRDRFGGRRR
jgi:hypothetical protein